MRRGRRGAEEWQEARSCRTDAIGSREVGLLADHATAGQKIARCDRGAIGFIEDLARAIGAEGLDGIRGTANEGPATGGRHVHGCHAERAHGS
jgi:hypothetical protein